MADINVGQITEALNDKMDRDNQNADTVSGADAVIEYQLPTSENGYKWYRKYVSGWVEQGGTIANAVNANFVMAVVFPVQMQDIYYTATTSGQYADIGSNDSTNATRRISAMFSATPRDRTVNGFNIACAGTTSDNKIISWEVKGMSA